MFKNLLQTTQMTSTPFHSCRNPPFLSNQVGQELFTDTKSDAAFCNSFTFFLLQPLTTAIKRLLARDILYESQFQLSFVFPCITLLALAKGLNSSRKTFPCFYTLYTIFFLHQSFFMTYLFIQIRFLETKVFSWEQGQTALLLGGGYG